MIGRAFAIFFCLAGKCARRACRKPCGERQESSTKELSAGEDFAALAREYSQGAGHADGGEIGWVNRGTLIAGLEEVAFEKLSVGQVSEPFRTSMGVHIVKLEGAMPARRCPSAACAPKIKEELIA